MTAAADAPLLSMDDLRARIGDINVRLGGPDASAGVDVGASRQDGTPHVEIDGAYHYVMCERGSEFTRRSTTDINELLFWIASDITFWRAVEFELRHRIEGQDFRRILFQHQRDLMARFGETWSRLLDEMIGATLATHPFVDGEAV
jgi:hypothetical protein